MCLDEPIAVVGLNGLNGRGVRLSGNNRRDLKCCQAILHYSLTGAPVIKIRSHYLVLPQKSLPYSQVGLRQFNDSLTTSPRWYRVMLSARNQRIAGLP